MKLNLRSLAAAIAVSAPLLMSAIPAKPGIVDMVQPDGSTIKVNIYGDERGHYVVSADGYALISGEDGFHYYATIKNGQLASSGLRCSNTVVDNIALSAIDKSATLEMARNTLSANRTANAAKAPAKGPGLYNTKGFPSKGEPRALVILVEFADKGFTTKNAREYFSRELNEEGFSEYDHEGSARDWFIFNSQGKFKPQFDVVGPVRVSQGYAYYGKNSAYGGDSNPGAMVKEACRLLDDEIDFSLYDNNDDGVVENVYLYYAGLGEADGGGADTIWPHQSDLYGQTGSFLRLDGVVIDNYGCSCEIDNTTKVADGICTFVHEFSHVMGLPDLYATDGGASKSFTPQEWSVLDIGSYNGNGCLPPNYSAFERYALDWINPVQMTTAQYQLENLADSNQAFIIINPDNTQEYYLLENRQQIGFDRLLPGHGMLVWHVDFVPSLWKTNQVNNTASHQYVDLIEADNLRTRPSLANDAFPGGKNVTSLTEETFPKIQWWNQRKMGMSITDIAESNGVISFKFNIDEVEELILASKELEVSDAADIEGAWDGVETTCNLESFRIDDIAFESKGVLLKKSDDGDVLVFGRNNELTITAPEGYGMANVQFVLEGSVAGNDENVIFDTDITTFRENNSGDINFVLNPAANSIVIKNRSEAAIEISKIYIGCKSPTTGIQQVIGGCIPQISVVNGNLIAPTGSRVFSLDGRETSPMQVEKGIYIVVTPSGQTAKVMVK